MAILAHTLTYFCGIQVTLEFDSKVHSMMFLLHDFNNKFCWMNLTFNTIWMTLVLNYVANNEDKSDTFEYK